jgi:hypothetical protein
MRKDFGPAARVSYFRIFKTSVGGRNSVENGNLLTAPSKALSWRVAEIR